jgi:hypothetical protein
VAAVDAEVRAPAPPVSDRPSLSRSLGAEQQEQEHASIALTICRRRSLECRGLTRVPCRRDDGRRRSRDSPGGVAPGTQREQGNKNIGDDETEVPGARQAAFSLAPTHGRSVRIYSQSTREPSLLATMRQPSTFSS